MLQLISQTVNLNFAHYTTISIGIVAVVTADVTLSNFLQRYNTGMEETSLSETCFFQVILVIQLLKC